MGKLIPLLALLAASGGVARAANDDPSLPPGEGRDRVAAICTSCHNASAFARLREGRPGWRRIIAEMAMHGAPLTPEDIGPIADYLSSSFGPGSVPALAASNTALPEGPGKELVTGVCGLCHGLDRLSAARRSPQEWSRTVARMISYGLPLSEDQSRTVTSYLERQLAPR